MVAFTAWDIEFSRLTRDGHRRACEDLARIAPKDLDTGNPNHPIYDGIFGDERDTFLARQYRGGALK